MKSNIQPTPIQNQKATEDFIKRSKIYFEQLQAIIETKKLSFIYDISTNTFTQEKIEDSLLEILIKNRISELRERIMNNVLNY